jgi:hypothetical protein
MRPSDLTVLGDLSEIVDRELPALLGDLPEELESPGSPSLPSSAEDPFGPFVLAFLSLGDDAPDRRRELREEVPLSSVDPRESSSRFAHVASSRRPPRGGPYDDESSRRKYL